MPKTLNINAIKPDKNQPRRTIDKEELENLAGSIKSDGLKELIEIDENNVLIDGECRWKAMKLNGMTKLKEGEHFKIIGGLSKLERMLHQHIKNYHRLKNIPEERDRFWKRIYDIGYKQVKWKNITQFARVLNVNHSMISDAFDRLELLSSCDSHEIEVSANVITETRGLPTEERKIIIEKARREEFGPHKVRDIVSAVKQLKHSDVREWAIKHNIPLEVAQEIDEINERKTRDEMKKERLKLYEDSKKEANKKLKRTEIFCVSCGRKIGECIGSTIKIFHTKKGCGCMENRCIGIPVKKEYSTMSSNMHFFTIEYRLNNKKGNL